MRGEGREGRRMRWVEHARVSVGVASVRLLLLLVVVRLLLVLLLVVVVLLLLILLLLVLVLLLQIRGALLLVLLLKSLLLLVVMLLLRIVLRVGPSLRWRAGHGRRRNKFMGASSHLPKVVLTIHGVRSGSAGAGAGAGCLGLTAFAWLRTRGACERQIFGQRGRWAGRRSGSGRGLFLGGLLLTGVCRRRDKHALCVCSVGMC